MKRQRKNKGSAVEEFPVWTVQQAGQAVPYINSIMNSIRDLYVEAQGKRQLSRKLEQKPGRPNRQTIIQHEEAKREADRLQERIAEAAQELAQLNIHCVEPVNGIAMIPFLQKEQLAWLVFDLFDETRINAWRFHQDALTMRRPLSEIEASAVPTAIAM